MKSKRRHKSVGASSPIRYKIGAEHYELLGVIGNDSHDQPTVYVANYKPENTKVAVKRVDLEQFPHQLEICKNEMWCSQTLNSPNIRRCHAYFLNGTEFWMIMPYMDAGSAWRVMQYGDNPGFDESTVAYVLGEVLRALIYIHDNGYVYNNLKASSILLDTNAEVCLRDFRDCVSMVNGGIRAPAVHKYGGTAATIPWLAPEILDQDLYGYDQKADIYSVGIVALELINNHAPYSTQPPTKVLLLKIAGTLTTDDFLGPHPQRMGKHLRNIINLCLHRDPRRRPTAEKLLQHPFFKNSTKKKSSVANILQNIPKLTEHLPPRSQYLVHQIISSGGQGENIMGQAERMDSSDEHLKGRAIPIGPAYEAPAWNE